VYIVLREMNFMNATEILMTQNLDYSEKKKQFLKLFVSMGMHSFNIYT